MCRFLEIDNNFLINYGGGLGYSTEICDEKKRFENMCNVQRLNIAISSYASSFGCDVSRYLKIAGI